MRLNQCTSVHINYSLIFLGLHHFAGWQQGNWRYIYDPCTKLIFPLCTVYVTDLWDAYLLSHCNQLWSIKLGHNTFQNLQVMKLILQQKQKAIQHTDCVFKCTMNYKSLKLTTVELQDGSRIWEKDSLYLSKITEHMHVHSHNSTLKVQWSDHFCGLVNLDSQVVHLMHHQNIPHEYKFFHVTNVFVYMRTVYEIVVQCKSALTTTSLFYFWYTSCFQRYYIMCIAVMVPTCSYAARKANEKNMWIKENTRQLREFTIIINNNNKNLWQNFRITGTKIKLLLCGHTMYMYICTQVIRQVPHS